MHDLDDGLSWRESAAREQGWENEQAEAYRLARIWGSDPGGIVH
jgi:hypothetical protein